MARQFQTPVSWGMGGNGTLPSSRYLGIGGFGQPKELSGVVIGDSAAPTGDEAYKKILVEDVDADKMTGILFYPKAWTVSLSAINTFTAEDYGSGGTLSVNFTGSTSGKFGRLSVNGSSASIWSTNKQPPEVLTKNNVFDLAYGGASTHKGNLSSFYEASITRSYSFYDDVVDQVITCDDDSGVESGRAIYSNRGATTSNGYTYNDAGMISASIDKIYYKPDGKCDVLITFDTYFSTGHKTWFAYGTSWDGGVYGRSLTGDTFTATILGKSVTLYAYAESSEPTGTLSFDVNFDVVQTEAWDFSTP